VTRPPVQAKSLIVTVVKQTDAYYLLTIVSQCRAGPRGKSNAGPMVRIQRINQW
jgi:hypothetical protein